MQIDRMQSGGKLTLTLAGRLDRTTAPELDAELGRPDEWSDGLILDFGKVDYISSAGLRVLLAAQRKMPAGKKVVVRGANEFVKDVFAMTGFMDILSVE